MLEYDGTGYGGWQRQKNAKTIQETLERAISKITGENIEIIGCSRTDAGVHARGFVGNFLTESRIPVNRFGDAINSQLPEDIVVIASEEVPLDFHSRFHSKGKTYSYTIQETLERAISKITGENIEVIGCSRTDAGVHARGFVGNFLTESRIPVNRFGDAINSQLPEDIVVIASEEAPLDFHSRFHSKGKTYSYTILNRITPAAINRQYMYHFRQQVDAKKMSQAAVHLVGTHDFAAFRNAGSSAKTTTRTITALTVEKKGNIIKISASADGFLYNMVRIIVGTLLEVGIGKINPDEIHNIILSGDRTKSGRCVPPDGLCLDEVYY